MNLDCPQCKRDDRVEKVTGVTKVQTQYGDFGGKFAASGGLNLGSYTHPTFQPWELGVTTHTHGIIGFSGGMHMSGVTESGLSRALSPPSRPQLVLPPQPQPKRYSNGELLSLIILCGGLILTGLFALAQQGFYAAGNGNMSTALFMITSGVALAIIGIAIAVLVPLSARARYKRQSDEWERACLPVRRQHSEDLVKWEAAAIVWDSLFYCHRCDIAYIPDGRSDPIRPELVSRFVRLPSAARAIGITIPSLASSG